MNTASLARRTRLVVAATVLLVVGCGDGDRSREPAPVAPTAPNVTTGSPSPSAPPSASPLPRSYRPAADGTDLAACVDGDCEVEIQVGDVIRFGRQVRTEPRISTLRVVSVEPRSVMFALPSGSMIGGFGVLGINGGLAVEMIFADGRRAVVRFSPTPA